MRDLRKYAKQTDLQLIAGFVFLLFLVGDGLIFLFYGREASIMGVFCLLGGLALLAVVFGVLGMMEWIVARSRNG